MLMLSTIKYMLCKVNTLHIYTNIQYYKIKKIPQIKKFCISAMVVDLSQTFRCCM